MSDFLERLPLRLASLAGLLVGATSVIVGTDLWVALVRVGVSFLIFGVLGLGLRILLHGAAPPSPPARGQASSDVSQDAETGGNVDQKTPEMTVDDLK